MRVPVVGGVGGGVGTTTVAVGLRGHDAGRVRAARPDILVCRATLDSLRRAAAVLDPACPAPPPVLAVTLTARTPHRPLRAQLDLLDAEAAGLVLLPHVPRWCTLVDPLAEAAQLLVEPATRLPRPLRAYAAALRELVAAVAASGRLGPNFGEAPRRPPEPHHGLPDERHSRRLGSAERPVRPAGPLGRPTASGAGHAPYPGPPPAPDPDRLRQGVRIVAPARKGVEPEAATVRVGLRGSEAAAGRVG
jgi:hypothetical protein